jgi:hypothetical protein
MAIEIKDLTARTTGTADDNDQFAAQSGGNPLFKYTLGILKKIFSQHKKPIVFYFDTLDTTTSNLWEDNHGSKYVWRGDSISVKTIYIAQGTADTGGTQPTLNIKVNGVTVVNSAIMSMNASDGVWQSYTVSATEADTVITDGDTIEFDYTVGTNGDNEKVMVAAKVQEYLS